MIVGIFTKILAMSKTRKLINKIGILTIVGALLVIVAVMILQSSLGRNSFGFRGKSEKEDTNIFKEKTLENFINRVGTFPYQADKNKVRHLMDNYPKLSIGMTRKEVFDLLGEPDVSGRHRSKAKHPGFLGWYWMYYIYKLEAHTTNLKRDKMIQIFFNTNGRVHCIVPSNIEGLEQKGTCVQTYK